MKSRKLLLPVIILAAAILAMAIISIVFSIAKEPVIKESKFAFSITYEIDGETVKIEDVYTARYAYNSGYTDTKSRVYEGGIGTKDSNDIIYMLRQDENTRIELDTNFYAGYMLGDPEYADYFNDFPFEPAIRYYDSNETEYTDEETLLEQGVRLVDWEYPEPIENSLTFSHFSILSGQVVFPVLLFALLAMVAIIIFVKKDEDYVRKPVDVISLVLNYVIGFTALPFIAIGSWLLDIAGNNGDIFSQTLYFTPALTALGIAFSIALRRKGYKKSALIVQFIGPAIFVLLIVALEIYYNLR